MVERCVRKDSSSCDPVVSGDTAGVTTRGVLPHTSHTPQCHGINKYMYINKILMKTKL